MSRCQFPLTYPAWDSWIILKLSNDVFLWFIKIIRFYLFKYCFYLILSFFLNSEYVYFRPFPLHTMLFNLSYFPFLDSLCCILYNLLSSICQFMTFFLSLWLICCLACSLRFNFQFLYFSCLEIVVVIYPNLLGHFYSVFPPIFIFLNLLFLWAF